MFEDVLNGDTDTKVHTFWGLLYVSFVYAKRTELQENGVSVCKPGKIDCQHTLRPLVDVGCWQILIKVTVS